MTRFGKLLCKLTGEHKWSASTDDIPEGCVFFRIDCVRCGYACDGVKTRELKRRLLTSGSTFLARTAEKLP